MEALRKWMVALDLSDHDQSILKFTKLLSAILHPEQIEFIFVAHRLTDSVRIHLPNALKYPSHDKLLHLLKEEVFSYFSPQDPINCEIKEGPVHFDLWHETYVKETDLFIAGSKPPHRGRGLFPKKFLRKSFCSVLFVPLQVPENISNIWVPVDFSEQSSEALDLAIKMSREIGTSTHVWVHHVYQLPHTYYYQGFPKKEILEAIASDSESQYSKFIKNFNSENVNITYYTSQLYESYVANDITIESENKSADIILMASGGQSRFSKYFLGSETEQMVHQEVRIPLLVIKKKTDHVKLWDLLSSNR